MTSKRIFPTLTPLALLLLIVPAAVAQSPLSFSKAFSPSTIGPGGVSMLRFDLTNNTGGPAADAAFSDTLPAAVMIATPANVASDCGGTVSAPDGGGTISLSGGQVPASGACAITVNVTSSTPGVHTNLTGTLTSDIGGGGTATADLTVATDRPGFSKAFAPSSVGFEGRSTLTFSIDNSANASLALGMFFTDNLPAGMAVADPANVSNSCIGGTVTAAAGGTVVSLSGASVAASSTCAVSVDVVGSAIGALGNVSGELFSGSFPLLSSGKASATLTVTTQAIALTKAFTNDPAAPGGTVNLEFTVFNLDRGDSATNIAFTDDLDAVVSGLAATGLPASDVCGTGSQLSGTGVLSLTGGNLDPESSCTFSVVVQVPAGAASGAFTNTTSSITADVGGDPETGDPASDVLFIQPAPLLVKEFLDAVNLTPDPVVGSGDDVVLRFTITNTSSSDAASDIAFVDELTTFLPFPVSAVLPGADPCGSGSSLSLIGLGTEEQALSLTGGSLAASDSCTFDVTLTVPEGAAPGLYTNTTEPISGSVGGETLVGNPATDDFGVLAPPSVFKQFTDDPVAAGGTVTLEFTVSYDENANGDLDAPTAASDITFMDDLDAALSGLAATGLPASDVCGTGSSLTGTSTITLTGGSLGLGESCTFSVALAVPAAATAGSYTNTTSNIQATVLGVATMGNQASDDLRIAGLELTKEFTDDPVIAGGTVNLQFTVSNISPTEDATSIVFTDNLDDVLDGLVATNLPLSDVCGTGSAVNGLSGNTFVQFVGGSLTAGTSCTFDVSLSVPAAAASDTYGNITSGLSASIGGSTVFFDPAADELTVSSDFLTLAKEFIDDPVAPGGTVTLRFTLENLSSSSALSDVNFSDDLEAALSGLVATGLPISACGGTLASIDGGMTVDFTGGSLAADETCSIDVVLSVPSGIAVGTTVVNTTSAIAGTSGGLTVTGDPASDELAIAFVEFSKAFDGPVEQGATTTLTFTIDNVGNENVAELSFNDDLEAVVAGLVPSGLPAADVCGAGSSLSESGGVLTLTGGSVLAGGSCSFSVDLTVPAATAPGDYQNVTSELQQAGLPAADPASATLTVIEAPVSEFEGVVLLAIDEIKLEEGVQVLSGSSIVNSGGGKFELKKNGTTPAGYDVKSDEVKVEADAVVASVVFYNDLDNSGTITGTLNTPLALPVFAALPPFVTGPSNGPDVTVAKNDTLTLAAGTYGKVKVEEGGTLVLSGGVYNIEELEAKKDTNVTFDAAAEIRARKKVKLEENGVLGPAAGSGVTAAEIVFYVDEANAEFKKNTAVTASFYLLNKDLKAEEDATLVGVFIANKIEIKKNATVELESYFEANPLVLPPGRGDEADSCLAAGREAGCVDGIFVPRQVLTDTVDRFSGPREGLTIVIEGRGGVVTTSPVELPNGRFLSPLFCGGSECNKAFPAGSVIKLMARPDGEDFQFLGWGGDCRGSQQIITVSLGAAARCTATFGER